jgi:hydrogenase maturation factor
MLVPAYTKIEELNTKIAATAMDPYYKYYHLSYAELTITVDESFWQKVQMVSVNHEKEVCGYFKAGWTRPENHISSISITSLFAKDIINFFKYIMFELKPKKINFYAVVNNPAVIQYDKLVEGLGGYIVGIKKYEHLINDKYYDLKIYEVINDYWKCNNCNCIIKRKKIKCVKNVMLAKWYIKTLLKTIGVIYENSKTHR